MEQPELFVFAGPNGAGKSTLSSVMVPPETPIFDGDKEFLKLQKQFPGLDSSNLYDAVNGHMFDDWKKSMQAGKITCAFETNFRNSDVMKTVSGFSDKGYATRLFYFGLDDIALSIERVKLRVEKGGHNVSIDNIKANYEQGLMNLKAHYGSFDQVLLMKASSAEKGEKLSIYLKIANGKLIERTAQLPLWADQIVQGINSKLSIEQSKTQDQKQGNKKDNEHGRSLGSGGIKR